MKFLGSILEKHSSFVSLAMTIVGIFAFSMGDDSYKVYVLSFVSLTFITLFFVVRGNRYKGYYSAFSRFNSGFADIHSISNVDIEEHVEVVADKNLVKNFLTSVQTAFEDITESKISVCIKVIGFDEIRRKYFLYTFERDRNSPHREVCDTEDANKDIVHWLESNTSFNSLFSVGNDNTTLTLVQRFFIKRYMPLSKSYKNSRVANKLNSIDHDLIKYILKQNVLRRIYLFFLWPVDYRSSIVVPIIPYKVEMIGEAKYDSIRYSKIFPKGFLCIDSTSSNGLKIKDVEIMRGLADGIYNDFEKVLKLVQIKIKIK